MVEYSMALVEVMVLINWSDKNTVVGKKNLTKVIIYNIYKL